MATVTCVPATATAKATVVRIDVEDALANDATAFDGDLYPSEPELRYYLKFTVGGVEKGRSYVFSPNPSDGTHQFNNYIFPSAGAWTVTLANATTDASVATASVTVS